MGDRPRGLSLRAKTVLLAASAVTGVLVIGGLLLVVALRSALANGVGEAALQRAHDLAALAVRGSLPAELPAAGDDEALAQVVGPNGEVVAASEGAGGDEALTLPRPPAGESAVYPPDALPGAADDDDVRVAAVSVEGPRGLITVYVAASLDDVEDAVAAAAGLGLVGLPVLVLVLAAGTWVLVGRTLAPVAAMTSQAEAIGAANLEDRLPEPRSRDEVARLAGTLNGMLARLEGALRRQRRFVADAAHELRSPVASLRAQLETAQVSPSVDWSTVSADLLDETARLQDLAEQLLLLARLDDAGAMLRRRPVDLDDVADRAVGRLRGRADVHLDTTGVRPVQVEGDPVLLERVLDNLLANAVRHARSRVVLTTTLECGAAVLAVDDDGPGIPTDQRERVLHPFTRLDDDRDRDTGGAGLGLAVARDVVTAHGGTIVVESSSLGGARVRVRLPMPPGA